MLRHRRDLARLERVERDDRVVRRAECRTSRRAPSIGRELLGYWNTVEIALPVLG
jgi:hypothetical protein